jgi:hypothetical protein
LTISFGAGQTRAGSVGAQIHSDLCRRDLEEQFASVASVRLAAAGVEWRLNETPRQLDRYFDGLVARAGRGITVPYHDYLGSAPRRLTLECSTMDTEPS